MSIPGVSIAGLMGTVGGNLGMFTGMSVMTIVEWLEASAENLAPSPHHHHHLQVVFPRALQAKATHVESREWAN